MRIRPAVEDDLPAIQAIYAHHVATGLGTFETEPPDVPEMRTRHARIVQTGLPYLVAEDEGRITGYGYASEFRPRAAYRSTVEDSIYVAHARRTAALSKTRSTSPKMRSDSGLARHCSMASSTHALRSVSARCWR